MTAVATVLDASTGRHGSPHRVSRMLLPVLAAAAIGEAVLLRAVTRTFIHIPGMERFDGPLGAVAELGRAAYYLAVVLAVACLLSVGLELLDRSRDRDLVAIVVAFLVAAVGLRLGVLGDVQATLVVLAAVATAGVAAHRSPLTRSARLPLTLFVAAFLLSGLHASTQFLAAAGVATPSTSLLLLPAEVAAVLGAVLTPRLAGRTADRMAFGIGGGVAVLAFGGLMSSGPTLRILMLWNLGLGGWLPDLAYAVAAGALVYTLVATVRADRPRWGVAIVLLTCGGVGLHSTYQTGLVVTALVLLVASARRTAEADEPRHSAGCSAVAGVRVERHAARSDRRPRVARTPPR